MARFHFPYRTILSQYPPDAVLTTIVLDCLPRLSTPLTLGISHDSFVTSTNCLSSRSPLCHPCPSTPSNDALIPIVATSPNPFHISLPYLPTSPQPLAAMMGNSSSNIHVAPPSYHQLRRSHPLVPHIQTQPFNQRSLLFPAPTHPVPK